MKGCLGASNGQTIGDFLLNSWSVCAWTISEATIESLIAVLSSTTEISKPCERRASFVPTQLLGVNYNYISEDPPISGRNR
jgi:hypothetical protein